MNREIITKICERVLNRQDAGVYTVINGQFKGATALVDRDGMWLTHESLRRVFEEANSREKRHGTLLTVEGMDIFYDRIVASPKLILCGGGHVSLPVAEFGDRVGFSVTVIDEREEFANHTRFPMAEQVLCTDFETGLTKVGGGSNCYYVIVTRGHRFDRACLEHILQHEYAYVGMIGSKSKVQKVFDHMLTHGYTKEQIDSVHSPIGLDIGANTPEEIAISILAELIQVRNQSGGDSGWSDQLIQGLQEKGQKCALCTIISKRGSAPRSPGARMLVMEDGTIYGTVGGGAGEATAIEKAKQVIKSGESDIYSCSMLGKTAEDQGMICGGVIDVFIEPITE